MTFININTRAPMTQDLAKTRGLAKQAKDAVVGTAAQFQKLDQTEADVARSTVDEVTVHESSPAELPKTFMEKVADQGKTGEELGAEPKKMAAGNSRVDEGGLKTADILVKDDQGRKEYSYERQDDGTEVYMGPTESGYAVVRENSKQGTLFVDLMEEPNFRRFQTAVRGDFEQGPVANDPANSKPQTLRDALDDIADVTKTSGSGTYMEGVQQRAAVVKNLFGAIGGLFGRKS